MNPYEQMGRARKVTAILALIPIASSPEANEKTARWLAELEQFDRDRIAVAAGIKKRRDGTYASTETWRQVVEGARRRRVAA